MIFNRTATRTLAVFIGASLMTLAQSATWKVAKSNPVPGDGGFDYVVFDASANRLYASHGNKVDVLDAASGQVLGSVQNTPGVHGIAIIPQLHRGFTTNGGNATVSMFDTQTLKTLKTIPVDKDPDFTFYDRRTGKVLVCHGDAAEITEIDPKTAQIAGKIPLGGGAEAAVIGADGTGYVNLEEEAEVVHFDPVKKTVLHTWPITGCKTPTGLAIDSAANRLFIGCRSQVLAVMDASNGHVIQTLPIGEVVDAVVYDVADKLIFASNGGGTISVIHQDSADKYTALPDIITEKSARTMALDPKTDRLFLSAAQMEPVPAGEKRRPQPKPGSFHVLVVSK